MYLDIAEEAIAKAGRPDAVDALDVYINGNGNVIPREGVNDFLIAAGCNATDWSEEDIDLIDGWEDIGSGRLQGNLF